MATVIITAQADDLAKWEAGFQTHVDLFRKYTATSVRYGSTDENELAIIWEVQDPDVMLSQLELEETATAMEFDGIRRDTVKVYVVDKVIDL